MSVCVMCRWCRYTAPTTHNTNWHGRKTQENVQWRSTRFNGKQPKQWTL